MIRMLYLSGIEQKKLHHRKLALLMASMLLIELLWIWYSFDDARERWAGMEYYGMLYLLPQLIVIFFPLTLGILASRLCDIEHRGNNFKLLCTVENKNSIYRTKFLKGLKYVLLLTVSQLVIMFLMGSLYHYAQSIPWDNMVFFATEIFVISICIFLLQLLLSLFIENQLIPLVVGLIGSFSGLFTMYVPVLRPFTIWGYYVLLSPVDFWWNSDTKEFGAVDAPCKWGTLAVFAGISALMYLSGRYLFEKKEV